MAETGTIEVDGYAFRYRSEGSGADALVIGSAIYYPRSFSQGLRQSLRLHFVDYRGLAQPPASGLGPPPSLETLIDDLEKVRQQLALDRCLVIGHSAHALLALEYAKKYSRHVTHVVMIGISPSLSAEHLALAERHWQESVWPERKRALEERRRALPDAALSQLPADAAFVAWNVRRAPQSWFDYQFDSSVLWQGVTPNMPILDYVYRQALRDIDITKGLEVFDRPVLLALGRFDYIIAPPSCWDPLRPHFRNLTVRIFERSGHSPQYEEAAHFDEVLLHWLQ